jgi:RimJ/RimL family protein N-acetyltransferase
MLKHRFADKDDVELYFNWANDEITRANSYNKELISYESHVGWFLKKVQSPDCFMYVFLNDDNPVGQVRIDKSESGDALIGISVDINHRGKGYAPDMLMIASDDFLQKNPDGRITAYVFIANEASYKSFLKAGYILIMRKEVSGIPSYILEKR